MAARCIGTAEDGRVCGSPGVLLDEQRGGLVCAQHAAEGRLVHQALRRAIQQPDRYLAAALAEQLDEDLAAELGCPVSMVWRLRLAGWPRVDRWHADLATIAAVVGCDVEALAALLARLGVGPAC